jgi:tetratricopeptide (TPR) repeat protein
MSDIFISYASQDQPQAQKLAVAFEQHGWSVWWDRQIPPGKTFAQVIQEQLEAAQCVIVLWSQQAVASKWVRREAAEGERREILIPALIEDIDLLKIPFEFRNIEAANLVDWNDASSHVEHIEFDQLVAAITQLVEPASQPTAQESLPQEEPPPPTPAVPEERDPTSLEPPVLEKTAPAAWPRYAAISLVLVLVGVGGWYFSTTIVEPTPNHDQTIQQHLSRGKSHHDLGEYQQALTELTQAQKLDPEHADVLAAKEKATQAQKAERKLGYQPSGSEKK